MQIRTSNQVTQRVFSPYAMEETEDVCGLTQTTPLHMRDRSICRSWYPKAVLIQSLTDTEKEDRMEQSHSEKPKSSAILGVPPAPFIAMPAGWHWFLPDCTASSSCFLAPYPVVPGHPNLLGSMRVMPCREERMQCFGKE